MNKEIRKYWISPKISYKTYKLLHDKTAPKDSGPTPKNFGKILWKMLKDRRLNIYITNKSMEEDTWFLTLKDIHKKATIISNPPNKLK